jgi:hypothetical protein
VEYSGLTLSQGKLVTVLDSSSQPLLTLALPKSLNSGSFFFSSPSIQSGSTYSISTGGTLTSYTDTWNGWYDGGTWSGGTQVQSFTVSSTVTGLGTSNGMGGGNGGGGNGGGMGPGGWH